MQIVIPNQETKSFIKPSRGELFGNLWSTKNIDMDSNKGKIRLSERTYRVFDSGDVAALEIPVKFIRTNADVTERWWALTQNARSSTSDGLMFKTTTTDPLTGWFQDDLTSSPTDFVDDMEIFGQVNSYDRLVAARDTDLAMLCKTDPAHVVGSWTTSWWITTLGQAALTASNPHPLEQFINMLLVVDGNVVHTIDDSLVVVTDRIALPKEYQIIWMVNDGTRVYFGTRHLRGGRALIFPWDGTSKTYDSPLSVDSDISLAGVVPKSGVLHTINGKGQLMKFNGQAFDVIASLPIAEKKLKWSNNTKRQEMVHPNGMKMIGNEIHILMAASTDDDAPGVYFFEEFRAGIWAYNEDIGLYNKYSIGQYDGETNNDWGSSVMRFPGALVETDLAYGRFLAGCEVYSDNVSTLIKSIIASQVEVSVVNRGYFITSQIQASSIRAFWQRLNLAFKKLENSTDKIIVKYRTVIYPNRRTDERMTTYTITWTDADTFTVTSGDFANYQAGDEVEIIVGKGAGAIVHISSITGTTPNYTVNLEEEISGATGVAHAVVNRWAKLGEISDQTIQKKLFKIAKRAKWIQLKIELRGTESSPELEELLLEFNLSKR